MRRTHLGVQAAIVLIMVALVSWPEFRPVRAQSVWRYAPSAVLQARTDDAARFGGDSASAAAARRRSMAVSETAFTTSAANAAANALKGPAFYAPPEVVGAGGKLNALLGIARTSLNMPIPYARLLLRNIRTGQVFARATANQDGQFSFLDLDANSYIIELLGADGAVVATSTTITMSRGELRQAEVRVASAASAVRASLGGTLAAMAPEATTVAASADVTRTTPTQTTGISPR